MADNAALAKMAQKLRRLSIESTTEAGSGHPTSCMSAAEIMSVLFFDEMRWDPRDPSGRRADIFVLSKGHAAPVLWAALKESGAIDDDLMTLRRHDSRLEGHPTPLVPWVRVTTGSLGQGLSVAAGMAWARKLDGEQGRVYVLMGDGEVAEGSVWEASEFADCNKLSNVCAIIDLNRLGQSGPTMHQHHAEVYERRWQAFGWETAVVDGHDVAALKDVFARARKSSKPFGIVARTLKGKGVSFVEDKEGWHGKPLKKGEELTKALAELGDTSLTLKVEPRHYEAEPKRPEGPLTITPAYEKGQEVATREAFGAALAKLAQSAPRPSPWTATPRTRRSRTSSRRSRPSASRRATSRSRTWWAWPSACPRKGRSRSPRPSLASSRAPTTSSAWPCTRARSTSCSAAATPASRSARTGRRRWRSRTWP
jgi:transketolase